MRWKMFGRSPVAVVGFAMLAAACAWAVPGQVAFAQEAGTEAASGEAQDHDHPADDATADHGGEHGAGEHGAAEHGEEGHGASGGPLAWQTDAAIWTAVVFLLLLTVLTKFAWKPLAEALDRRERSIAEHIAAAKASNEEAKRHLAEYERKLAAAQDEVRAIMDEARRDAEQMQRDILEKANQDAGAIRERARREIETATAVALKELADQAARLSVDLAGRILHAELDPQRHARLIEEALKGFPGNSQN